MRRAIRQIAATALGLPGVPPFLRRVNRDRAVVFMLHRFEDPDHNLEGHSPQALREVLEFLRRHRFPIVHVDDLLRSARSGGEPTDGPAVAFVMDDGYRQHVDEAVPIFAEFDAPAAIFPVSGFLDGDLWMWWDRLTFILTRTSHRTVTLPDGLPRPVTLTLAPDDRQLWERRRAGEAVKVLPTTERDRFLEELAERCEVEVPESPPPPFQPMSWNDARRCETMGIRFGPHTVTHPILSRESDDRARWEIEESCRRVRAEVANPMRVFCYPNGDSSDFGLREIRILEGMGIEAALTARPGYVGLRPLRTNGGGESMLPFAVPRYSFSDRFPTFVRIVSGLARGGVQPLPPVT